MDDDLEELLSRLFALLTARLEDGATLAVEGQRRQPPSDQPERAQALATLVRDAGTIADAVVALTSIIDSDGGTSAN